MASVWSTGICSFRFLLFVSYYLLVYWSLIIFYDLIFGRIKVCGSYMLVANVTVELVKKQKRDDMMTVGHISS